MDHLGKKGQHFPRLWIQIPHGGDHAVANVRKLGKDRFHPRDEEFRGKTFIIDRKSTRLNSSHVKISYAVFCLKKKNRKTSEPMMISTSSEHHSLTRRN